MKKIIFYNFIIFFILLISIELIFGYWFDENNFGIHMRKHRNRYELYETKFNNKEYKFIYKRNFYGFRGEQINNLNDIKFVFLGGSTGNERFLPENLTIVGRLNEDFKKKNININIINASVDGKTLRGHLNDFKFWFSKLKNFNPDYYIIYTGINDSVIDQPEKYDFTYGNNLFKNIRDYITNNSISVELIKKFKWKYFSKTKLKYDMSNSNQLYKDFVYINYNDSKNLHNLENLFIKYNKLSERYKKRIKKLYSKINKLDAEVIFITQIKYDGLKDEKLFLLNEILKEFSTKRRLKIIKLDEIYNGINKDFYDHNHTTPQGSERISKIIFENLNKIIFP